METPTLTPDMLSATEALAISLRSSEPVILYHLALETLETDEHAATLLERLSQTQVDLRRRQAHGEVSSQDLEQLRVLQRQVQASPVIRQYAQTQQAALAYLREINQVISALLGTDFGAMAKLPGCC